MMRIGGVIAVGVAACTSFGASEATTTPRATDAAASDDGGADATSTCGDVMTSRVHCGRCNNPCADGQACDRGTCTATSCESKAAIVHPVADRTAAGWVVGAGGAGTITSVVSDPLPHDGDASYAKLVASSSADVSGRLILDKGALPDEVKSAAQISRVLVMGVFEKTIGPVEITLGFQSDYWMSTYNDAYLNSGWTPLTTSWERVTFDKTNQDFGNAPWTSEVVGGTRFAVQTRSNTYPIEVRVTNLWMEICYR